MNKLQSQFRELPKGLKMAFIIIFAIAAGSLIATGMLTKEVVALKNPAKATEAQAAETIAEVRKVLVLPLNETPTLATVADPAKLSEQPFFANALTGDVVLIYSTSKKAILWRPSTKQVVEVSALNPGASNTSQ